MAMAQKYFNWLSEDHICISYLPSIQTAFYSRTETRSAYMIGVIFSYSTDIINDNSFPMITQKAI